MNSSEFLSRIRYSGYLGRVMSAEDAATFIRPGMVLGVSGFTIAGYPKAVAGVLADRARKGEKLDLTVYSGASLGEEFDGELARVGAFRARMPYQTNKDLRNAINAGEVSYHDVPLGQMPVWVKNKFLRPVDVAIIEATAIDENGNIIPTTSVGTSNIYAECAKQVIIEVNSSLIVSITKIKSGRPPMSLIPPKEQYSFSLSLFAASFSFF